jgi:hypothetical protein
MVLQVWLMAFQDYYHQLRDRDNKVFVQLNKLNHIRTAKNAVVVKW